MKQFLWENKKEIRPDKIIYAVTSEANHEVSKLIILAGEKNDTYIIIEGFHSSNNDFADFDWEATEVTGIEELKNFLDDTYDELRSKASQYLKWSNLFENKLK